MNICEIFIRRPVMTTLLMLSILLFGITAYRKLPVSDLHHLFKLFGDLFLTEDFSC